MTIQPSSRPEYDVAILGSGFAGTVLAAVLARGGAKTLILDAGAHPRFAIGESTIPYTSMMMRLVAERYDVPELKQFTTFYNAQAKITTNGGVKKNFGFLYHRPGEVQNPQECHEFPIPRVTHRENHYFRQDLDSWLLHIAVKYGAIAKQGAKIVDVDIDDAGVTVKAENGEEFRARYVVDASGFRSPIATKFGLRETPTRLWHQSRSLFTHMLNVTPYEDTVPHVNHGQQEKWSQGTLHHIFEGGWLWVIPFNNHPRATNPLVSIGLQLDPRLYPKDESLSPEQEFRQFLDRFPSIRPQFENAVPARQWVSTGRLQYSPVSTIGYRYCLTSHAAGFIDPLFSRGMSNSLEIVNALTFRLLDALKDDDFSTERFLPVQELEQRQLDFNDDLVACAYASFQDFKLWDAWCRVWALSQILRTFEVNRTYAKFLKSHDPEVLKPLAKIAPDASTPDYEPLRTMYWTAVGQVRDVAEGRLDPETCAKQIMAWLTTADYVPPFGLADPDTRFFVGTPKVAAKALRWAKRDAPDYIGTLVEEGLTLFIRHRLDPVEYNLKEEVKHSLANHPRLGKALRTPAPR